MDDLSILVVDDDEEMCNLMRLMLSKKAPQFSIATVNSGQDCLEYLEHSSADSILADYQMPGMNGIELLSTLRERGNNIPFIFVTGQGNEDIAREAFSRGASDYFVKEGSFAQFDKIVNSIKKSVKLRSAENTRLGR